MEVRVLFGAYVKAPLSGAFSFLVRCTRGGGQVLVATLYGNTRCADLGRRRSRWPDRSDPPSASTTRRTAHATKGKRARSVHIGPGLTATLKLLRQDRLDRAVDDCGWLFLCPVPKRGRYARRTDPTPPNRRTIHDWHGAALQRAELRDMPLHALRHTAAASWLSTGQPPIFVARQLGHRSITTCEEHYGHLETWFMGDAAARTEAAIAAHSMSRR